jgi:hypothetical protein
MKEELNVVVLRGRDNFTKQEPENLRAETWIWLR